MKPVEGHGGHHLKLRWLLRAIFASRRDRWSSGFVYNASRPRGAAVRGPLAAVADCKLAPPSIGTDHQERGTELAWRSFPHETPLVGRVLTLSSSIVRYVVGCRNVVARASGILRARAHGKV